MARNLRPRPPHNPWTREAVATLAAMVAEGLLDVTIAERTGRTVEAVRQRRRRLQGKVPAKR